MISIENKGILKDSANLLLESTAIINKDKESVKWVVGQIEKYWESTGQSKVEVIAKTNEIIGHLEKLVNCQNGLGNSIIEYLDMLEGIGAKEGGLK